MQQSRTRNSVINSLTSVTTQILTVVMNFVVKIVFTRTISMEYLGVNGLFANIITMLSLADLGIGTAIPYSLYKPLAEGDHHKVKVLMKFYSKVYNVIGVVVLLIGLGLIPFLPYLIKGGEGVPDLNLIYALFVIHSASSYFFVYKRFLIDSDQKGYITARITFIFSFVLSLVQIGILYLWHNFILYLVSSIVFVILQNIYISHKATKLYPYIKEKTDEKLEKEDVKEITKNVGSLFIYKVGSVVTNGTDNMIISKFLGLIPVGIYSNYVLVTKSLNNVVSQLFTAITSSIGNLVVTTNKKHSQNVFERLLFLNFWFYAFFSIALMILINPFIDLFFGSKFVLSETIVIVLVVDVSTIMTSKHDLNNINYMMVDYGLDNMGKENIESEITNYILLNTNKLDDIDVRVIDNEVYIYMKKYEKSLISHIFNIKGFEIVSEYKGTIINDKKSIERIK